MHYLCYGEQIGAQENAAQAERHGKNFGTFSAAFVLRYVQAALSAVCWRCLVRAGHYEPGFAAKAKSAKEDEQPVLVENRGGCWKQCACCVLASCKRRDCDG
jgi:hypothetical protein